MKWRKEELKHHQNWKSRESFCISFWQIDFTLKSSLDGRGNGSMVTTSRNLIGEGCWKNGCNYLKPSENLNCYMKIKIVDTKMYTKMYNDWRSLEDLYQHRWKWPRSGSRLHLPWRIKNDKEGWRTVVNSVFGTTSRFRFCFDSIRCPDPGFATWTTGQQT